MQQSHPDVTRDDLQQQAHPTETYFGFEPVTRVEKTKRVEAVFDAVASRYDVMNNVLSLGIHHVWKRRAIAQMQVRPGQRILDLAGGSGDLSCLLAPLVGANGQVILADINAEMLAVGRDRLLNEGIAPVTSCLQANAEQLPLGTNQLDGIIIGFGFRNFSDQPKALRELYRVCRPGAVLVILEFSLPTHTLMRSFYDWYSFQVLPKVGQWVAQDEASYRYLAESIRMHPTPTAVKDMIEAAGFEDCQYQQWSAGIVAVHRAYKY